MSLRLLCETFGRVTINGVQYVWDYYQQKPMKKSEMTKEMRALSNKVMHGMIKPLAKEQ